MYINIMLMAFIFLAYAKAKEIKSKEIKILWRNYGNLKVDIEALKYKHRKEEMGTSDEDSSEELDRLWRRYGKLKADVEMLKAKHWKDEMDSSCEDSSEENEENEESGDSAENKGGREEDALKRQFFENIIGRQNDTLAEKDEEGFSTFPFEVTYVKISRTNTEYKACTAHIEAPEGTYFVCSWTDLMSGITPVSLPAMNGHSTIPYPKLSHNEGKYNVTCYTTASFLFLTAYIDRRKHASVVCDMMSEGTSGDFQTLAMKYKTNKRIVENEITKTYVDFKLLRKADNNGGDIDYSSTLYWINGSVYESNRGRNHEKIINLSTSAGNNSVTRVTFEMKTTQVANLRGNMNVYMTVRPIDQMSHGIRYRMTMPQKDSLIDTTLKGEMAFKDTYPSTFLYGKFGSVACKVTGNPLPYIEILKNKGNLQERLNLSYTYFNGMYLTASKVWEKVDNDVAGNYTCKAISSQEILQTTLRVDVAPVALIENTAVIKNESIVTVFIEASSSGNGDIILMCMEENSEGTLLLSERYYQDIPQYEESNDTLSNKLEYYRPVVVGFSKDQRTSIENNTQMTATIVLDSTMELNPPSQIACTTMDPVVSIPVKWVLVPLNITTENEL